MEALRVEVYSAVSVVHSPSGDKFLFSVYDGAYPRPLYRGRANLIGGNREEEDESPLGTLRREICEEFSEAAVTDGNVAQIARISSIREGLLESLRPYKAFITTVPEAVGGARKAITLLASVYSAVLPDEVFRAIEDHRGERFVTEGGIGIESRERLAEGQVLFAWDSGVKLSDFLGMRLPNPEGAVLHKTFTPMRENYSNYVGGRYDGVDICFGSQREIGQIIGEDANGQS